MAGDDTTSTSTPKPVTPIAQYQCPKLKNTNYTVWAIQIKVILEAHGLWEAIESKEVDIKKDKATIAFLYQALTEDVILQVAGCETAKELWDSLKTRHVGEEKVQQARLQSLMIEFNTLQMKDDDTIVASIEQTSDLDDVSLDEITGKLKAFEERIKLRKGGQVDSQENLLFAHGKHSGKGSRFSKRRGRSNFSRGNWQSNRNNSQEGNSNHKGNSNKSKGKKDLSNVKCFKCNKFGHFRKDCRVTSTTEEQSNLILEDDEPSLLMTMHETKHEEVLLNEGQIQPGKYASGDASIWYLDNGASNHMTGVKSHFKDINESVTRRVRFGDGSQFDSKPYSPQQNGVVERRNRTVLSTTRSMMKAMKLPLNFWAEAVRHTIYILNRVPTRALEDKTPYEALYNRKPNLENLRIFGCTAYAKITIPHLKKLDDRSIPMIYLGVEDGSKACRLYDPITKKKHVSRDVKFMETKPWDWNKDEEDTSTQDTFWTSFVVEGVDNENATPVNIEINDNIENPYQEQDPINDPNSPITPSTYTYNLHSEEEEEATTSFRGEDSVENI
ncbi:zinc finger, CCHC-type containing protein [Tanacetum coccineum]